MFIMIIIIINNVTWSWPSLWW